MKGRTRCASHLSLSSQLLLSSWFLHNQWTVLLLLQWPAGAGERLGGLAATEKQLLP